MHTMVQSEFLHNIALFPLYAARQAMGKKGKHVVHMVWLCTFYICILCGCIVSHLNSIWVRLSARTSDFILPQTRAHTPHILTHYAIY